MSLKGIKFIDGSNKKDAILSSMMITKNKLENSVNVCETISSVRNKKPKYEDIEHKSNQSKDKYWLLRNEITMLNHKLTVLYSHTSMVLDKYRFSRDVVSGKIFIGSFQYPLVLCDSHSIRINDKTMPFNSDMEFKLAINKDLKIEYNRYTLNYTEGKIDTAKSIRHIVKNALNIER